MLSDCFYNCLYNKQRLKKNMKSYVKNSIVKYSIINDGFYLFLNPSFLVKNELQTILKINKH